MCGIVGIYSKKKKYDLLYQLLFSLQHRGQDSYGYSDGTKVEKYIGLINNKPNNLNPPIFLAHTRYRTSGSICDEVSQPLMRKDIVLVHNGNIHNLNGPSDSYALLSYISNELENGKDIISIIKTIIHTMEGAFFIILSYANNLIAFKDKNGIRPGVLGRTKNDDIVIASEDNSFYKLGIEKINDIGPGEIVFVNSQNINTCRYEFVLKPCIFEYIYLAHPESVIYKKKVSDFRRDLAIESVKLIPKDINIDVVCCIPNSARVYAKEIARKIKKPYIEPIVKNKRSFIMPDNSSREEYLARKFIFDKSELIDRDILLIDDSIVRGTTAKFIIKTIKKFSKKKVYFLSCSPKVININTYGINIIDKSELIAHNRTHEEIEKYLDCDKLIYQKIDNLYKCSGFENLEISIFE